MKYSPEIKTGGEYEIFMYFSNFQRVSPEVAVLVKAGGEEKEVVVRTSEVKELGLPSGDWVSLGRYKLEVGEECAVKVLGKGDSKVVVADALIWKPIP